MNKLRN